MSFWPSTIATRNSSVWVALNNMRFISCSPALTFHGEDKPCGAVTARGLLAFRRRIIHWVEEDDSFLGLIGLSVVHPASSRTVESTGMLRARNSSFTIATYSGERT